MAPKGMSTAKVEYLDNNGNPIIDQEGKPIIDYYEAQFEGQGEPTSYILDAPEGNDAQKIIDPKTNLPFGENMTGGTVLDQYGNPALILDTTAQAQEILNQMKDKGDGFLSFNNKIAIF